MCRREADVKGFGFPMPDGWLDRCCLGTSDRLCFMNGACERKQRPRAQIVWRLRWTEEPRSGLTQVAGFPRPLSATSG